VALKATGIVTGYDRQSDDTVRVRLDIYTGANSAIGILGDPPFSTGATAASVNAAIVAFVRLYSETEWGVVFGLADVIKVVNPHTISVVSASGSAIFRIGLYLLPWEWFRLKLR
jgi:hypothetical protein